jgi:hypothetical protein
LIELGIDGSGDCQRVGGGRFLDGDDDSRVPTLAAGSAARRSLGTAVFGGMIVATVLSLALVPALYVIIQGAAERVGQRWRAGGREAEEGAGR